MAKCGISLWIDILIKVTSNFDTNIITNESIKRNERESDDMRDFIVVRLGVVQVPKFTSTSLTNLVRVPLNGITFRWQSNRLQCSCELLGCSPTVSLSRFKGALQP